MRIFNRRINILAITLLTLSCSQFDSSISYFSKSEIENQTFIFENGYILNHLQYQLALGPRIPGSLAHSETINWITSNLSASKWEVERQDFNHSSIVGTNIIGKIGEGQPWLILGAHYDSRLFADYDNKSENKTKPVPGANDGASGVALLLEMARVIPVSINQMWAKQIWLVFFDLEDNGNIPGWDWILGSQAFAAGLKQYPDAVVIVDMIGDAELNIHIEKSSDPLLSKEIWDSANFLGYGDKFLPSPKYRMIDDHTPFLMLGIPAVDIIDFDYKYYHTTEDTLDKVKPENIKLVGETILHWLKIER